ncbi:hypothetical protein B0J14DRAFT_643630 [Halenospora varia]|nr:hypothetical protein B0J14DRAFT_643630 [Halenospora varia]
MEPSLLNASHKRNASATSDSIGQSDQPKQKLQKSNQTTREIPAAPQHVYIVLLNMNPQYGDQGTDIQGVYRTIKDANNCVRRVANEYDSAGEEPARWGIEADGRVYWSCMDAGEGDGLELKIEKWGVKDEGAEEEEEWDNAIEEVEEED